MAKEKGRSTTALVEQLVEPVLRQMGFTVWDVRYEKEGPDYFLRILIDKNDGYMDMNACEEATRAINPVIDEADPIDGSYYLEVGSPGLGRKLTRPQHFEMLKGQEVTAHLIRPENGLRDITGILCGGDDEICIEADGQTYRLAKNTVSYVKLNDDKDLF